LATPYHARCKPPEADRPRRYETYRGWEIRITDKPVDESRHSALIQVCGPGQDPRRDGTRVVAFSKRAASWEAARDATLEHAQAWIDREDSRDP
jgi:hypothetical protein